jgi:endoglucanase Acf2
MKKNIFLVIAAMAIVVFAALMIANVNSSFAQAQLRQSVERKFEEYRKVIKDSYQVDIKNFKDQLKGGYADGKPVTNYDLKELLEGIKWEREHTGDSLLALEMAMDHLERIPNYYTHLVRMERECASEKLLAH